MEIRKYSTLAKNYKNDTHPINEDFEELKFMRMAAAGDAEGCAAMFRPEKLFTNEPCAVDAPYGRFEGIDGIKDFANGLLARFNAESAEVVPVIQTRSGGRSVTEMEIRFISDGMMDMVPMFVVADLRTKGLLEEVRIYCHCTFVPGLQAYRKPMFKSKHLEIGDPGLLTGAVREYYEALHATPGTDVQRVLNCCEDYCLFGGYEPATKEAYDKAGAPRSAETVKAAVQHLTEAYTRMNTYIPSAVAMRYETIIDDGVNGIIEWVHVVSEFGQKEYGRIALSGIAAYERGPEGKLIAIRISDYAWLEKTIEWDKTETTYEEARKINYIDKYPGCDK